MIFHNVNDLKKISDEHTSLLNTMGFDWVAPRKDVWNDMYLRLVAYHSVHNGDTKVPAKYDQDPRV